MAGATNRGPAIGWLLAPRPAALQQNDANESSSSGNSADQASAADISGRPVPYALLRARCTGSLPSRSGRIQPDPVVKWQGPRFEHPLDLDIGTGEQAVSLLYETSHHCRPHLKAHLPELQTGPSLVVHELASHAAVA